MIDLTDVQAGILRPVRAGRVEIAHLQAADRPAMVELLRAFSALVTTAADIDRIEAGGGDGGDVALTIGLTAEGLRLAGVSPRAHEALPIAFTGGMRAAAPRLGDEGASSPAGWHPPYAPVPVGDRDGGAEAAEANGVDGTGAPGAPDGVEGTGAAVAIVPLHALVVRHGPVGAPFDALPQVPGVVQVGPTWVGERRDDGTEPFGFRDDISNPVIEGGGRPISPGNGIWDDEAQQWRPVRAGEALLGHVDESGTISGHPDAAHIERNGSYLVVRRLEQDVAGFHAACEAWAKELTEADPDRRVDAATVAAQMVGRHRDGTPLGREGQGPSNDFRYRDGGRSGVAVPPSSHIRRTNPRDDMEFASAIVGRHQLFRRSYPYADDTGEGLLFLACCADLARQFEFVQAHWVNDGDRFGLGAERDPLLGERTIPAGTSADDRHQVSIDVRGRRTRRQLQTFVTTRGGEYVLLPSPSALRLFASGRMMP